MVAIKHNDLVKNVRSHTRFLLRELGLLNRSCTNSAVSTRDAHALFEINQHGSLSIGELGQILNLEQSSVSRAVGLMEERGLIRLSAEKNDRRGKRVAVLPRGQKELEIVNTFSDARVNAALSLLNEDEQKTVENGLALYSEALSRARRVSQLMIRPIRKNDNESLENVLRTVMAEFGAVGEGYPILDKELRDMHSTYRSGKRRYYVVSDEQRVYGGGGIAPVPGHPNVCELRKMHFLPEVRNYGFGKKLVQLLLSDAKKFGYERCVLETLPNMQAAQHLYRKSGFRKLRKPFFNSGHYKCDVWYEREV